MPSGTRDSAPARGRRSPYTPTEGPDSQLPVVTHADVVAARRLITSRIHRTPLVTSRTLGEICGDTHAWLKMENFQRTGSFKPRGALNKVLHLTDAQRKAGLVAASAGNHAQAVAYAATSEGVKCTVVMPETAPVSKIEASKRYGAEVVLAHSFVEAFRKADQLRSEKGYTFIHPYDDEHVIAGAGTVGLEIIEDLTEVDAIVVGTGGGGLVVGIAAALKATHPHIRIIGVEPEGAAGLHARARGGRGRSAGSHPHHRRRTRDAQHRPHRARARALDGGRRRARHRRRHRPGDALPARALARSWPSPPAQPPSPPCSPARSPSSRARTSSPS